MTKSILLTLFFLSPFLWAQHKISATFIPKENFETAILYKITPQNLVYTTHVNFDADGQFHMPLDSTLTKGVYRLVYALPQEVYNFDLLYNGKEDIELRFDQETGVQYISSKENTMLYEYHNTMAEIGQNIGKAYNQKPIDAEALTHLFETQKTTQAQFEKKSENLMVHEFIRANKRFVPKQVDSLDRYIENVKAHYFDAVDFDHPLLQASNFFSERAINYVFGIGDVSPKVDTLKKNIDDLLNTIENNAKPEIRYEIFKVLRKQMLEANYEQLALYVSKNILMPLAESLNDHEGIQAMRDFERTALGTQAPNFDLEETSGSKTLYDLKGSSSYVLIFWSSSCSHCVDELPVIHEWMSHYPNKNTTVVAVGLEEDPYQWRSMKYEMPSFIHKLALGKWEHPLVSLYNISATPHYLVLDENKVIVAKPQNLEDLRTYIQK